MEGVNLTSVETFLIMGFSDFPQLQVPLFGAFLLLYLTTLMGNLIIMVLIYTSSHLHTPMYFFLTHLSLIDICYISVIFPPMLAHFFQEGAHMTLTECLLQVYFFSHFVSVEFLLLSVMAFDRYVAICNPLRYLTIMNKGVCLSLAAGSWVAGIITPLPHTLFLSGLSYCKSHTINHFFCDLVALETLSCSSTHTSEILSYILGSTFGLVPFSLIIMSYAKIISAILRIQSTEGRRNAFSTCASHLLVVILFYGSLFYTYMRPSSTFSMKENKIISLSYVAFTPLCNPIIYSLKNQAIKNALKKKKKWQHSLHVNVITNRSSL